LIEIGEKGKTDPIRRNKKEQKYSPVPLKECIICITNISDAVIMLCSHGGLCFKCAE
jgi:hypothetical protein